MAGAGEEIPFEKFPEWLRQMGARLQGLSFREPLQQCAVLIVGDVRKNFEGGHAPDGTPWAPLAHPRPNSKGADRPLRNTDVLMASVVARGDGHIETITDTTLEMGTNREEAAIQQYGGTITPKNGQYLAIPLTADAARYDSPRDFPRPLYFVHGSPGRGALMEHKARGDDVAQYALVPSVTIPARPFLGISDEGLQGVSNIFAEWLCGQFGR